MGTLAMDTAELAYLCLSATIVSCSCRPLGTTNSTPHCCRAKCWMADRNSGTVVTLWCSAKACSRKHRSVSGERECWWGCGAPRTGGAASASECRRTSWSRRRRSSRRGAGLLWQHGGPHELTAAHHRDRVQGTGQGRVSARPCARDRGAVASAVQGGAGEEVGEHVVHAGSVYRP